jgi:DNA-binding response OmpR family regulator
MSARIMVVEDEEALTTLLRYNLDAEGYDVETVARGDDADTRLKERVPDLVVLDWMLPGLSGIELCRRLRARPETKQLPIIMLTARGEESERVRGLATGADDYIVKPFHPDGLRTRMANLLKARERPSLVRSGCGAVIVIYNVGAFDQYWTQAPPNAPAKASSDSDPQTMLVLWDEEEDEVGDHPPPASFNSIFSLLSLRFLFSD